MRKAAGTPTARDNEFARQYSEDAGLRQPVAASCSLRVERLGESDSSHERTGVDGRADATALCQRQAAVPF